ncbi:hypothetical protein F2Q70_00011231 [Brassica cretica]|uniref:Uncharacterized protein n=1 Tax=Brassica cretica TaxID=69181 RepID=A0A8S9M6R6_BRACR|nr:hypothetical protein F2Q70_00011231 [Brassica cretica]
MKSRVILSHRERRDKHNYTQIETMERKPFDVETTEDHKPYSSVDGGGSDSVDSFEDEQKKLVYRGWKVMPFIIGNETFEKIGIIGTLSNLLVYLTSVFNLQSVTAATIISAFSGTINFGTFLAAFLCDTYFGRYKTLSVAVIACFLIAFLLMGLALLVVGAGGIRPCNLAFGADQFNPKSESGKKGINSFFNWYFFTFTFAQIISLTLVVYIQSNVSWTIGLSIPVGLMFLACVIFFAGHKLYVKVKASGSPLAGSSTGHVIAAAIKKRGLKPVKQPWIDLYNHIPPNYANSTLKYTDQLRFLDKAAIMTPEDKLNSDGTASDPWKLCTMQKVEEVKCILRVIPIWFACAIYYLAISMQMTYPVFQALQSDRLLGSGGFKIPAATYVVFLMSGMTVFIIIYDRVLVPSLKRVTGLDTGITLLQRIGAGIFFAALSLLVSGFIEERRRTFALTRPTLGSEPRTGEISSMSAMWLIPQLVLAGVAEAFAAIGQMEFYYKQFPENMKSFAGSIFYVGGGVSSYLASFLISTVHRTTEHSPTGNWLAEDLNKAKLDYFYFMLTGLMFVNFLYFLLMARWYRYKGTHDEVSYVVDTVDEETKQQDKNSV